MRTQNTGSRFLLLEKKNAGGSNPRRPERHLIFGRIQRGPVLCAARACCVCRPLINGEECIHPSSVSELASEREAFLLPQGRYSTLAGSERLHTNSLSQASLFVFTRTTAEKLGAWCVRRRQTLSARERERDLTRFSQALFVIGC